MAPIIPPFNPFPAEAYRVLPSADCEMKASTDEELIVAVVDVECAEVDDSADDEMCDEADDDAADEVEETAAAAATAEVVAARATVEVVTAAAAATKLVVEVVAANKVVEVTAAAVVTAAVVVAIAIGKRVGLRVKSGSEEDGMVGGFTDVDERPPSEKLNVKVSVFPFQQRSPERCFPVCVDINKAMSWR